MSVSPSVPPPSSRSPERLYVDEPPYWKTVAWKQVLTLGAMGAAVLVPVLLALLLAA